MGQQPKQRDKWEYFKNISFKLFAPLRQTDAGQCKTGWRDGSDSALWRAALVSVFLQTCSTTFIALLAFWFDAESDPYDSWKVSGMVCVAPRQVDIPGTVRSNGLMVEWRHILYVNVSWYISEVSCVNMNVTNCVIRLRGLRPLALAVHVLSSIITN